MKKINLKKILIVLSSFLFLSVQSCASYIKVRLLKPAQIEIGSAKKISVSDFTFTGNWETDMAESLGSIAASALVSAITGKDTRKVTLSNYSGKEISDKLTNHLLGNGYFKVIKREEQLKNFENIVNADKTTDKDKILKIKSELGVDAIISGSGNYLIKDIGEWIEDSTTSNGVTIKNKKYRLTRKIRTELTYQFINASNSEIQVSRTLNEYNDFTEIAETEEQAKAKLSEWRYILDQQINKLLKDITLEVAPHYEFEDREIKEGKTYVMKTGFQAAKRENWEEAKKAWEQLLNNKNALSKDQQEDIIFAQYNLGIYHELQGNFDQAIQLFEICYKETKNYFYYEAEIRAINRKNQVNKLKNINKVDIKS